LTETDFKRTIYLKRQCRDLGQRMNTPTLPTRWTVCDAPTCWPPLAAQCSLGMLLFHDVCSAMPCHPLSTGLQCWRVLLRNGLTTPPNRGLHPGHSSACAPAWAPTYPPTPHTPSLAAIYEMSKLLNTGLDREVSRPTPSNSTNTRAHSPKHHEDARHTDQHPPHPFHEHHPPHQRHASHQTRTSCPSSWLTYTRVACYRHVGVCMCPHLRSFLLPCFFLSSVVADTHESTTDPRPSTPAAPQSLSICVKLCEAGVNPEALAAVVKEIRRESAAVQVPSHHVAASRQQQE
jgi:hypothetical protein